MDLQCTLNTVFFCFLNDLEMAEIETQYHPLLVEANGFRQLLELAFKSLFKINKLIYEAITLSYINLLFYRNNATN